MKKIDNPNEEEFDLRVDTVLVINIDEDKLYRLDNTDVEIVSLSGIAEMFGDKDTLLLVITESPLDGTIYRYNNYETMEWYEVGKMCGYA